MAFTDYLANSVMEHIAEGSSFTQPTLWVGLATDDQGTEPSGGSYARVRPGDDTGRWTITDRQFENKGEIQFPEATASWGTISHIALFDSETGGEMLAIIEADESRSIGSGDTPSIGAGELTVTLD